MLFATHSLSCHLQSLDWGQYLDKKMSAHFLNSVLARNVLTPRNYFQTNVIEGVTEKKRKSEEDLEIFSG